MSRIIRILLLQANPKGSSWLKLDEEQRMIQQVLEKSAYRDRFELKSISAVNADDLLHYLTTFKPQIVHFCGHGAGEAGLVLENDYATQVITRQHLSDGTVKVSQSTDNRHFVQANAIAHLFYLCRNYTSCVILNTCYSEVQATAISQHTNYVIGTTYEINDRLATKFSSGFYTALMDGRSVEVSYETGRAAIMLDGLDKGAIILKKKPTLQMSNSA